MHVGATLTLSGRRAFHAVAAHHRRDRFAGGGQSVSFHLDGYYSSTSEELCMLGSGTYSMEDEDGWPKHLPDVVLRLRVPRSPSLKDPFVTGELKGSGFDAIALVSYAEGDTYEYGQRASCPPLQPPIGMTFWFPVVWTILDRSIVAGRIWKSSQGTGSNAAAAGAVSASSIDFDINRDTFTDVNYTYTTVDEAKQRYFADVMRSHESKANKGTFPSTSYTYHDFQFRFYMKNKPSEHGEAYPVTIGSVMVNENRLAAGDSFSSWHAKVDMEHEHELLKVSYDIYTRHLPQRVNWMNMTSPVTIEERLITAEGVYDPKTGVLCMIGCQELEGSTDTDCQILITVHFASLDAKAQGRGKGMDIALFGMYAKKVSASISRMDLESVMLVVTMTLPCIFTALQILRAKRNPEAGTEYAPFLRRVPYELKQAMLRVPTLIAFVLQLRLLQLASSARRSAAGQSKDGAAAAAAASERRALWVCLPLYLLGGALTVVVHMVSSRRATREDSLAVRVGPEPATLWEDVVSSAGLALDGFLLPQVAMHVLGWQSESRPAVVLHRWHSGSRDASRLRCGQEQGYVPSLTPSNVYASRLDDRFGVAWDIVVPCRAALLSMLLFRQQRLGGSGTLFHSWRTGEYQMVST
ncbi:unnamed protein product [Urochloa decumbens]|uniref:RING-type E3 ubiquitin transferase n=1 Tax=Urochloa decumbens TaxID=240449 RepID=A0ABC9G6X9_9POAL